MTGLLRPEDLLQISSDEISKEVAREQQLKKKKKEQMDALKEAFLQRDIHPEVMERINKAVSIAARHGEQRVQVLTFPASYCNDAGRRINNLQPDWPDSLEGFARRAYDYYQKELRPLGYKLNAEILNYPGGMPGEVGLFLRW
jgi:hypothetical protein